MKKKVLVLASVSVIIAISIIAYNLLQLFDISEDSAEYYKKLHKTNDSLIQLNIEIDSKYRILELKSDSVKNIITASKERIIYIKQKQDEEIKTISGFNGNQLYEYFSGLKTPDYSSK